jgi:predicted ATPase/class 3 adenylate cyclase
VVRQPNGTVTLLFTDLEGSTRLLERLGAEEYADVLARHRLVLRKAFVRHGGYEVDEEGDAFLVAFSGAHDAAAAAREAQQGLRSAEWPEGVELSVRIGIHTGEPLPVPPKYVGLDVHRAARIMAAAHGGQVVVSETTAALLDGVSLRDLGPHRLKDLLEPIGLHQLLVEGLPEEFPPLRSLQRTNLPVAAWPLLGREGELAAIRALLTSGVRLVTLTGPGGSGKTRLALQAAAELADEFADGVFFAALAPLRDVAAVPGTVADAVGLQPDDDVVGWLGSRRVLLVLDNLEHLQGVEGVVADLLVGEAAVLATSRAPLHLSTERELEVEPLASDAAVELFVGRAAAAGRALAPDATVAEVCRRLDNLPLALELAAARSKLLPPATLLERLGSALPLLTGGARDLPERQQTLRATIEWSHDLLDADAQAAFRRLSVFRGSFTLEAVEAVTGAGLDELAALLDQSLLKPLGSQRFFLLETLREYAREQLDEVGETAGYALRHARWYLARLEENYPEMRGPRRADSTAWFVSEEDNLRAMLDRLIADAVVEAAKAAALLHRWWVARNVYLEPRQRFTELLARDNIPDEQRAELLLCLGTIESRVGDHHGVEAAACELRRLVQPGSYHYAQALNLLAFAALERGELEEAVEWGLQALEATKSLDNTVGAPIRTDIGEILAEAGRMEEARAIAHETRAVFLENHDLLFVAVSDFILARYDLYEHSYEGARTTLVSAVHTIRRLGHRGFEAEALRYLGLALCGLGRRVDSQASFIDALEISVGESPVPIREATAALGGIALTAEPGDARAARLSGAVAGLRRTAKLAGEPRLRELERHFVQHLVEALGRERWEREQAAGAALGLDGAIALARSLAEAHAAPS